MRAWGNSKTGFDDFDRILLSSTSSLCPSPGTVCVDIKTFNSRNHITFLGSMTTKRKKY